MVKLSDAEDVDNVHISAQGTQRISKGASAISEISGCSKKIIRQNSKDQFRLSY
jgi:hypothetical protein